MAKNERSKEPKGDDLKVDKSNDLESDSGKKSEDNMGSLDSQDSFDQKQHEGEGDDAESDVEVGDKTLMDKLSDLVMPSLNKFADAITGKNKQPKGPMGKMGAMAGKALMAGATAIAGVTGMAAAVVLPIMIIILAVVGTVTVSTGIMVVAQQAQIQRTADDSADAKLDDCSDATDAKNKAQSNANATDNVDTNAQKKEMINKIYSVLKTAGGNEINIAGILGNWEQESHNDATSVEGIYSEPYHIGENKKKAIEDLSAYTTGTLFPMYAGKAINHDTYLGADKKTYYPGIGLGQWTGPRAEILINFAKANKLDWWEVGTQLTYMLGEDGRSQYLADYLKKSFSSPEDAAMEFFINWEGINNGTGPNRSAAAASYYVQIKEMTVDKSYGESILKQVGSALKAGKETTAAKAKKSEADCNNKEVSSGGDGWQAKGGEYKGNNGSGWQPFDYDGLPDELKQYAIDPKSLGMPMGDAEAWAKGNTLFAYDPRLNNQCTALSACLMGLLWEKDGKPGGNSLGINGNGIDMVGVMAGALGVERRKTPISGDIFSNGGGENHTGVVCHVFENDDILIIEQNAPAGTNFKGSGQAAGGHLQYSYRYITKARYQEMQFEFASPEKAGYTISKSAKSL